MAATLLVPSFYFLIGPAPIYGHTFSLPSTWDRAMLTCL